MARLGKQHQRYQTVDDLSGPARVFHERVAQSSGLSEEELVKGVFRLEQKLLYWQQVVKDGADIDMDEMEGIERAPSGRAAARLLGVKNN
jgi:RNA polymerase I-specific transcription initiation factor RRN7